MGRPWGIMQPFFNKPLEILQEVDAVLKRVTQRTQETIKLKQIYIQDSTGEVKVSMWRQLAETSIEFVSKQHDVVVDGFYKEDDIVPVCKQEDVYSDYKCPQRINASLQKTFKGEKDRIRLVILTSSFAKAKDEAEQEGISTNVSIGG
ncbi:Hypothetical predicted protein [Mytilus galloprovincialis]|uniref:Uncharacterized protein n=1 Tax=Mytilus galloprovincialis TaxID=29158 RepID=A0A8B6EI50_MYTGA|nr:Hypothetical predicted protein [Mytilus galloprovincialis]